MGFHQLHLRLSRTPIDLDIQDSHLYFIIIFNDISKSRHGDDRWTFTLDSSTVWSTGYVRVLRCKQAIVTSLYHDTIVSSRIIQQSFRLPLQLNMFLNICFHIFQAKVHLQLSLIIDWDYSFPILYLFVQYHHTSLPILA